MSEKLQVELVSTKRGGKFTFHDVTPGYRVPLIFKEFETAIEAKEWLAEHYPGSCIVNE